MRRFPFHLLLIATDVEGERYIIDDKLPKSEDRWFDIRLTEDGWVGTKSWDDITKEDVPLPQKMTDLLVMWVMMGGNRA